MATPIGHPPRDLGSATFSSMTDDEIKRLKEAAEIVAEAVRQISGAFSTKIPRSVSVEGNERGIYVQAGGPMAPNAYPFDPDNDPPVYHPLYGNKKHWYAQPYKPFREMAADASADKAAEAFAQVIDDWAKRTGFDNRK